MCVPTSSPACGSNRGPAIGGAYASVSRRMKMTPTCAGSVSFSMLARLSAPMVLTPTCSSPLTYRGRITTASAAWSARGTLRPWRKPGAGLRGIRPWCSISMESANFQLRPRKAGGASSVATSRSSATPGRRSTARSKKSGVAQATAMMRSGRLADTEDGGRDARLSGRTLYLGPHR